MSFQTAGKSLKQILASRSALETGIYRELQERDETFASRLAKTIVLQIDENFKMESQDSDRALRLLVERLSALGVEIPAHMQWSKEDILAALREKGASLITKDLLDLGIRNYNSIRLKRQQEIREETDGSGNSGHERLIFLKGLFRFWQFYLW